MPDILPGIWGLSPLAALVGAVVTMYLLIATGRLIPRSSHDRELAASDKRGDEWKEAALRLEAVNTEIRAQNTALIESARTSAHFFQSVPVKEAGNVGT